MNRKELSVHESLNTEYHKEIEEHRKLESIISTIYFVESMIFHFAGNLMKGLFL